MPVAIENTAILTEAYLMKPSVYISDAVQVWRILKYLLD